MGSRHGTKARVKRTAPGPTFPSESAVLSGVGGLDVLLSFLPNQGRLMGFYSFGGGVAG